MLIDSHAHLDDYGAELDEVIARARAAGLVHVVAIGQWPMAKARAEPARAAAGECGLDFHYERSPREVQRKVFRRQLRLAKKLRKPVVVHTREADLEAAPILSEELGPDGGVIHCFTSDWTAAQRYLALGMFLS